MILLSDTVSRSPHASYWYSVSFPSIEAAGKSQALNFWPIEFMSSAKASVISVTVIENLRQL